MLSSPKAPLNVLKRRQLLYQAVQEEIKAYILRNGLQPGDPLPSELELAQQLSISRNSVREAVKALEALGILEARTGSGLFVRDFTFDSILDNLPYGILFALDQLSNLLEVRFHLEYGMLERVAQEVTPEQLAQLHALTDKMRAAAEQGLYDAADDRAFHQVLYQNLDNPVLLRILDIFWMVFRHAQEQSKIPEPRDPLNTYRRHTAIVKALEQRNVEAMRKAMKQHNEGIESRVRQMQSARATTVKAAHREAVSRRQV